MLKLKMVHKGLILVAVPLVSGIVFDALLYNGVSDANRLVERQLLLKDADTRYLSATECSLTVGMAQNLYFVTAEPFWQDYMKSNARECAAAYRRAKALLKNEPGLSVPRLSTGYSDMLRQNPGGGRPTMLAASYFSQELRRRSDQASKEALASAEALRKTLYFGMACSFTISALLASFFCLHITNRLLIIINNTINLSKGANLQAPLKGSDEIAQLDHLLYKSAIEIRELERFKKEMIGVVSHELKSPLTSVGAFLSSLSNGVFGSLSEKARIKVERTNVNVKRLRGLVGDLLYLDRLELEMHPTEFDVDELISSSIDNVSELCEKAGIKIDVQKTGALVLYADRNRLLQVIVNLLSNAIKFSPPEGQVTLSTSVTENILECRVTDNGRGIPEALRKQIFEPFQQVDASDAINKKGTGLGLTISRSIIKQHGGEIGVESEEGRGSTFWFKIPTVFSTEIATGTEFATGQSSGLPGRLKQTKNAKFSVLQQGLLIISLPLIFQLAFSCLIIHELDQVDVQTHREINSRDLLDALRKNMDIMASSLGPIAIYVYTREKELEQSMDIAEKEATALISKARKLASGMPEKLKDINEISVDQRKIFQGLQTEKITGESYRNFLTLEPKVQQLIYNSVGPISSKFDRSFDYHEALVPSMLPSLRALASDSIHKATFPPFMALTAAHQRLMKLEKKDAEHLSRVRAKMIRSLQDQLFAAVCFSVLLSIGLSVIIMRGLCRRLSHISQNIEKLVKREELDAPIIGNDEIAYLDQVLFKTSQELVALETFKKELISVVSHELRTPLLSVCSALELLGTGLLGELSAKGQNRLKFAQEEAARLIRLINDLLDIEKMEAGKFILDRKDCQIQELVRAASRAVAELAELKSIKLEVSFSDSIFTVYADSDRICQVLINLLSNAIKFSPEHGFVTVSSEACAKGLKISVKDQGRGIPAELKEKIFDRFVQVEKSDETKLGGSGLGLAICKAIVEQHGGEIGVHSAPSAGSLFWFILPTDSLPIAAVVETQTASSLS